MIYAHIRTGPLEKEPLFGNDKSHLECTAAHATTFAREMIPPDQEELVGFAQEAGRLLGLWHDLGKCSREFQTYLAKVTEGDAHALETKGRVDHSTAGARHAASAIPVLGQLLAFAIAGHHAGLPDWSGVGEGVLKERLGYKEIPEWRADVPPELLDASGLPPRLPFPCNGFVSAFFTRMLFSCLTDADFLATEKFMDPDQSARRGGDAPTMDLLSARLRAEMDRRFSAPTTEVHRLRQEVLRACREAAALAPGFFSLNVPTGGGKTLSSLAFALEHAVHHGQRRVICAIPFTSIIEQNARIYRDLFADLGDGVVLEHHANLDAEDPRVMASRLATEHWDAPLIVTTNVRFFETLFAHRPGACRKLHRIARSVIVLDEAQALPPRLLKPCLRALRELVEHYGCTVVLSTATQPALEKREGFAIGLSGVREIIPDPHRLRVALKRVTVTDAGALSLEVMAQRLADEERAMVIVNSRKHARDLFQRLQALSGAEGVFHLSALMCPQHRTRVLATIKQRLEDAAPCRVVSTQLVEAGVDLDFPVVWRAQAGLDSIAQAAGRCNREGRLPGLGRVLVFTPEENELRPKGDLGLAAGHAREVMDLPAFREDWLALEAIERYFRLHYWEHGGEGGRGWDEPKIMDCFKTGNKKEPFLFQFKTASQDFNLIEEGGQQAVIIPWDDKARAVIQRLRSMGGRLDPRLLIGAGRALQRYVVNVHPWEYVALERALALEILHDRYCVLSSCMGYYQSDCGLMIPSKAPCDPNNLIL